MRHRVTHSHIPQDREASGGEYETESHIHTYHKRGSHLVENMRHRVTHPHTPQERESSVVCVNL